jgi:hypothetical protein
VCTDVDARLANDEGGRTCSAGRPSSLQLVTRALRHAPPHATRVLPGTLIPKPCTLRPKPNSPPVRARSRDGHGRRLQITLHPPLPSLLLPYAHTAAMVAKVSSLAKLYSAAGVPASKTIYRLPAVGP